jgi:hypothetical protein
MIIFRASMCKCCCAPSLAADTTLCCLYIADGKGEGREGVDEREREMRGRGGDRAAED